MITNAISGEKRGAYRLKCNAVFATGIELLADKSFLQNQNNYYDDK